tara:strand:- start:560 stop:778 length:219 start_codon:yes stop_codon:yes gene_type:complete
MVGSFLGARNASSVFIVKERVCSGNLISNTFSFKVFLPLIMASLALSFAPEKPDQFASICQRHNSEIACQVW